MKRDCVHGQRINNNNKQQQARAYSIQLCKSTAWPARHTLSSNRERENVAYTFSSLQKLFALKMHNNAELQLLMIVLM